MSYLRVLGAVAALASLPALQPADAAAWSLSGSQGVRYFMLVDPAQANEAVYRQAAASVCTAAKPCIVLFWTDGKQVATRMPLTRAQRDALAAQYTRNPGTGQDALLLKCAPGDATPKGHCLK